MSVDHRSSFVYLDYLQSIEELLSTFDSNTKGKVSPSEVQAILAKISRNVPGINLEPLINEITQNFTGCIRVEDLVDLMWNGITDQDYYEKDLVNAFLILDNDKDGFISKKELTIALSQLGDNFSEEEVQELMDEVDVDCDGKINFIEFAKLMTL